MTKILIAEYIRGSGNEDIALVNHKIKQYKPYETECGVYGIEAKFHDNVKELSKLVSSIEDDCFKIALFQI